jgi:O-antigen/teichoic acid export membrane protein
MDMAAVRRVAIEAGREGHGRVSAIGLRAFGLAGAISAVAAVAVYAFAGPLAREFTDEAGAREALQAAAVVLPFVAVTFVVLGASRGLKIMRHTLYVQWMGQPLAWIALMLGAWQVSRSVGSTVYAYAVSWMLAAGVAWLLWHREASRFEPLPVEPGETVALMRFGAPRAPAALLSQAIFWTDYFIASAFVSRGSVGAAELGVYSASVRVAQVLVLLLTAMSYMFAPFVADLHEKGELRKLDGLFKSLTRWTLAGTMPLLIVLLVVPEPLLRIFGGRAFEGGAVPLRILLAGQAVRFVLIMVGRTGWDLAVYAGSFAFDLAASLLLVPHLGTEGAAIAQATTLAGSNALRLYLVYRFVGIQPFNRYYFRLAIPAAIALVPAVGVQMALANAAWMADLLAVAVVTFGVYGVAFLLLGLTPTEKGAIKSVLGRARASS